MFNKQMLKDMINERLSEAAGEIFSLFEQAVAEYQREIDRLKNTSEAQRVVVEFQDPQISLKDVQQTQTVGEEKGENTVSFHCKEETEPVVIKREDEPQVLITDVKSLGEELQPQGHQQKSNSEEPDKQESGGADTDYEEEDSDTGSDGHAFGADAPFSCSVRNKNFPKMKMHMRRLTSAKSKERVDSRHLTSNIKIAGHSLPDEAPDIARPFSCSFCERRFKLKLTLEAHMRLHAGENPCSCTECGVTFKKQTYLINHIQRVHSTEKPLQCTLCHKGFVHPNAFKMHMNSHTGERPFRCVLCGKGFTQKGTLKRHMVTHTGEKPFVCPKCGKNYSTKQNLTNHMTKNH